MSEWPSFPLVELVQDGQISYGVVQPGNDTGGGVPIVRVKDVRNGIVDATSPIRVAREIAEKHNRTTLTGGELLLSLVGTVGESAVAPTSLAGWNVARAIAVIRPTKVSSRWLQLCFESSPIRAEILGVLNTTVQSTLNLADLKRLRIPVPPSEIRCGIEEVLGALDDKIAANTKLAVTGDEWVRASLMDLNASTEETVRVGELIANRKELSEPRTLDPASNYVGLEHIPRRFMWASSAGTAESVTSTKAKFRRGDILFGKLRPYFHKVVAAPYEGVCSTDILVLNPVNRELAGFVLASVTSDYVVERATAASEGTRMPRTSWKDLAAIKVPWPGITEAKEFSARVSAVQSSVESLLGENQTLAETRDVLLPQLMSGKLRVKDAEKVLETAGL
jgi:type I restriction enzyme S subunit